MRDRDQYLPPGPNSEDNTHSEAAVEGTKPKLAFRRKLKVAKTVSDMIQRMPEHELTLKIKKFDSAPTTGFVDFGRNKLRSRSSSLSVRTVMPEILVENDSVEITRQPSQHSVNFSGAAAFAETSDSDASSREDTSSYCCNVDHTQRGKTVSDFVVQTDVFTLFNTIFKNSEFMQKLQSKRETANAVMGEWMEHGNETVRMCTYNARLPVKMGPKHCKVTEKQTLLPVSKPGVLYAIDIESNNSEVPQADSFYLMFHYCLNRVGPTATQLVVIANMIYRKPPWAPLRTLIDRGTWAGINSYVADLEAGLKKEFNIEPSTPPLTLPASTGASDFEKTGSRRPLRKKRPAPSIPTHARKSSVSSIRTKVRTIIFPKTELLRTDSDFVMILVICTLTALLLSFNVFLFIKVQTIEAELDRTAGEVLPKLNFNDPTR